MPVELLNITDPESLFDREWGPRGGDPESASVWLAGRVRARTPRGAAEFLEMGRRDYAARVAAGLRILALYERLFPEQYARSTRPPYTTERETEFYHLVNRHRFPVDLKPCFRHPNWVYMWIPVKSQLRHDFILGGTPFESWDAWLQLVIALCNTFQKRDWWPKFASMYGLAPEPRPRHYRRVSVDRFAELCLADPAYRLLPVAFLVASYKTGNLFIDAHPMNPTFRALNARFEWTADNVEKLAAHWREAKRMLVHVAAMSAWLKQDPAARMGGAVALWNRSEGEWEL